MPDLAVEPRSIGFVGLGRMGQPMVRRIAAAGYPVAAFDVRSSAIAEAASVAGVAAATTLSDMTATADTVILMLPDSEAVEQVGIGQGLFEQLRAGALVVDMSSSDPSRTRRLAERAATLRVRLVDAPVSGGVAGAVSGTLTIMVGCPEAEFAGLVPLLSSMGSRVIRCGDVSAGHAVKALNNLMSAAHLATTSEAMLAAIGFGLDPVLVLNAVNGSSGRSGSTENKWPNYILTGGYDSGFGLRLMLKDARIAVDIARRTGTPAELSARVVDLWEEAAAALPDDADHTEIARWLAERTAEEGGQQPWC